MISAPRRQLAAIVAVVALGLTLAGCSSTPDSEEANTAFCTNAAELQVETTKLQALVIEGNSTLADVQAQADKVEAAYNETIEAGEDVAENTVSDLEAAYKTYEDAIAAIPSDATVDQAKAAYRAALTDYLAAVAKAHSTNGC